MPDSLNHLLKLMQDQGATRFYAKRLAPNDNSKNQVYLGGDFSALNIIPHGEIFTDSEQTAGSKRDRAKAPIRFFWVDKNGKHRAPDANLILYPKYPEVRMSGFLRGCRAAPSSVMKVRKAGRIFVIGVVPDGTVLGFAALADHPIAKEINETQWEQVGVFLRLPAGSGQDSSKAVLLAELRRIYEMHWINSQILNAHGQKVPYGARNGGGYTLEAELGIRPNSYSVPDFMGWEIKQYGVEDFEKFRPKSPITLMTPEPTGGFYRYQGVTAFLHKFGYPDKNGKPDRINFGGIYACGRNYHADTGLRIEVDGFDVSSGKITDLDGCIALRNQDGESAAIWSLKAMMEHWNRKHAQAAYVPSLFRTPPPQYSYGPRVLLCEQTDFLLFLSAMASGAVYYDPGIKIEKASSEHPEIKRRSQFRVKHSQITDIYHQHEIVALR